MRPFLTSTRGALVGLPLLAGLTACPMDEGDGGEGGTSTTSDASTASVSTTTANTGSTAASTAASTGAGLAPTHTGLVSIQDMAIAGLPQAGHGLTVQIGFAGARAPVYEELPGQPTGCKAWVYDLETDPPPPSTDQGTLRIEGLAGGGIACVFEAGTGYACPLRTRSAEVVITANPDGTATFVDAGASFAAADIGRHVRIRGANGDAGAYPVVAVSSATTATIFAPAISSSAGTRDYDVVAGAGPTPGNTADPITGSEAVTISLEAGGDDAFHFAPAGPITPGAAFAPDDASSALLAAVPLDGAPFTLGCSGAGGSCGAATLTVVRLTTTDGDVTGLSPAAMPPPLRRQVDVLCATLGDAPVTVPAEAMALLVDANVVSPVTRIRSALMREGFALASNPSSEPPNPVRLLVGHGFLGFTTP